MFRNSIKTTFGVDIGTQTIKLVEVNKKKNTYNLVNYVTWTDLLTEVVQEKSNANSSGAEVVAEIIQAMAKQASMELGQMYIAIPSYLAFSAEIELPNMSYEELSNAVRLEAAQHIPVPIEQVQIDWVNLGVIKENNNVRILILALPNTVIARYQKIAELAKISIEGFELDIFSQMRATHLDAGAVCLMDIGARSSSIGVFDTNRRLALLRSFDVGGNHISNHIADVNHISVEEAEALKKEFGMSGGSQQVITGVDDILGEHVLKLVAKFLVEHQDKYQYKVGKIVLVGGLSNMMGITHYVQDRLAAEQELLSGIQVELGRPSKEVKVKDELRDWFKTQIWSDISLALGIALK